MIALAALALLAAPMASATPAPGEGAGQAAQGMAAAPDSSAAAEIRAAEAHLIADLEGDDRLAWVKDYTEDAVFQEGEGAPVSGRAALTELAGQMPPLSNVSIEPVRTMVEGRLAYVQIRGGYASGKGAAAGPVERFRGVMIWRKDPDGVWRMLHEMLAPDPGR